MQQISYMRFLPISIFFFFCGISALFGQPRPSRQTSGTVPQITVAPVKIITSYEKTYYGARLEPAESYTQLTPFAGTVENIFVKEGQKVRSGDALYSISRESQITTGTFVPLVVTARRSGTVSRLFVERGDEVRSEVSAVTIADVSSLKLTITVSDKDITLIKKSMNCYIPKITLPSGSPVTGTVSKIPYLPDQNTGLFSVDIAFSGENIRIPEMFAGRFVTVELQINPSTGAFVPSRAVISRYGKKFVYIVETKDGISTVKMKEVEILRVTADATFVSGLETGQVVAASNTYLLSDGAEVTVKKDQE